MSASTLDVRTSAPPPGLPSPPRRAWVVTLDRETTIAAGVLVLVAVAMWMPCAVEPTYWGEDDWDRTQTLAGVARFSILTHGQMPFWNPYMGGGLPLLANPQAGFLSPSFLTVLLAGEVVGGRLRILLALVAGLIGGYLLGRRLTTGPWAPYMVAAVFLLSSWYAFYMETGHEEFIAFCYLPWAVLFLLRGCDELRWAPLAGAVMALMVLEGGAYPVPYGALTLAVLAGVLAVQRRSRRPVTALAIAAAFGFALAGPKLLPTLHYLVDQRREWGIDEPVVPVHAFYNMFLRRDQLEGPYFPESFYYWHEYGCYVGWIPVALALVAIVWAPTRALPWAAVGILFLALTVGDFGLASPWHWLHKLPVFASLHDTPRFRIVGAFAIAVLAGIGLERLAAGVDRVREAWELDRAARHVVPAALVALVIVDLLLVNGPIFGRISSRPPRVVERGAFEQVRGKEQAHELAYLTFLEGRGLFDNYEPMDATGTEIRAVGDEGYRGEVWLTGASGTVATRAWSPNRLEYNVSAPEPNRLVVNQRYLPGWSAVDGRAVEPYEGMVSVAVGPDDGVVGLRYRSPWFRTGCLLALVAALVAWAVWRATGPPPVPRGA